MDNYICYAQGYADDPGTVPFDVEWDSGCGYPGDPDGSLYNVYQKTPAGYSLVGYDIQTCQNPTAATLAAGAAAAPAAEAARAQPGAQTLKPGIWELVGTTGPDNQAQVVRTESRQINNAEDMNGFLKEFYAQEPAIDRVKASKTAG